MKMICLIFSIFYAYAATATTIYFNEDGSPDYHKINRCMECERVEWISVEDRLPEEGKDVLTFSTYLSVEEIRIGHFWRNNDELYWVDDHIYSIENVTLWMPLPSHPSFKDGND